MALVTGIPEQLTVSYGASNAVAAIGVSGSYDGQTHYQIGGVSQGFRRNIWIWNADTVAWLCMPISPIQGTGNPNGSVTPDAENQMFYATDTGILYIATGITSSDWGLTN